MKSFEERLNRLENISEKMQTGELSLDEAVEHFEEGINLAKSLEKDLGKVERKIEILINQPEKDKDEPNLELFPDLSEDE